MTEFLYQSRKHRRQIQNPCGDNSSCSCSNGPPGIVKVESCQALTNGNYLISHIVATKIAIKEMFDLHSKENERKGLSGVGLVIANTKVQEIVDLNETALTTNRIPMIVFKNNSDLTVGCETQNRLKSEVMVFGKYGSKQFFGNMFNSRNVTFSNFSASLSAIYDVNRSGKNPWHWFTIENLILEGNFLDFPDLVSFIGRSVTIRNVISIEKKELLPANFLTGVKYIRDLIIKDSECVTLPKFYLDKIYNPSTPDYVELNMAVAISNIQQHSLSGKFVSKLRKLNHVMINDKMREVLTSGINEIVCDIFCVTAHETKQNCSDLIETEKTTCGICVKNIIGSKNLLKTLGDVCDFKREKQVVTTSLITTSTNKVGSSDTTGRSNDGGNTKISCR